MSRNVLMVSDVVHAYRADEVLQGVSITVAPGEVHCLLGPSGSGKSTLLRLIAGLETLRHGSIEIDDDVVSSASIHVPPERRAIGFVFQDFALFPHLNVRRNVLFGMPSGSARQRRETADALLRNVGMRDFATAMPHTLSGGQQQRVALVRALARRPSVMLLDEPFSGLDGRLREEVREPTLEVLRAAKVATLMVTHDPHEAMAVADRISILRAGRILQSGTPTELYEQPRSREAAQIFGRVNSWAGTVQVGIVRTPWGAVEVPGLDDDAAVEILVRPEAIQVEAAPSGAGTESLATVDAVVPEGALSRLVLRFDDGSIFEALDFAHAGWRSEQAVVVSVPREAVTVVPAV
ncbi:MAG: ABC transporter ATP-binding protein [Thermoanaerobaculia bacterium]|nr:ABC transporter ATP-binding protein [Thermoanaerobaculia bacterium]